MKHLLTTLLLFIGVQGYCQKDQNGNPVFNSVSINEETIKDFKLLSNYYTLKNNIENKGSSVFISARPSPGESLEAAIILPSEFFIIIKGQSVINMIMFLNSPIRKYLVITPAIGKQQEFECSLKGEISENRAAEFIKEGYDPMARIEGNKLYSNNKVLNIISNKEIREDILALIETQSLADGDSSQIKMLSKEQLKAIVLAETKEGGKLDFFTEIKGREMEGVQIKQGIFTTRIGIALYKWGRANFELGVNTAEDALEFWTELKGRQPNKREETYIRKGFNKELEK